MLRKVSLKRVMATVLLGVLPLVAGCGGSTGGNSGSSGQTIIVGVSSLALQITTPSLQLSQSTTATATFHKADGTPASGIPVNFTTTLGTLTPANGVVTSDANGSATITLTAGLIAGSGQLNASATVDNKLVTTTGLFVINPPPLHLANLQLNPVPGAAGINLGASQGVSVEVQDAANNKYTNQPVSVVFTTLLAGNTISTPVTTINGVATTTYKALASSGSETITASISGSSVSIPLTVIPLSAGSISFVSASPITIGLKGMGGSGIQETSLVTFKVVDTSNAAKPNQSVDFTLNTTLGGITLGANGLTTDHGSTDQNGLVTTIVHSGTIATPVRVTASTTVPIVPTPSAPPLTTTLFTQSDQLSIGTGIPAQDGFSLSVANMNPEAWNVDGVTTAVTVRLSDHFHNPVPDGTAVSFTTSGGLIGSSCRTVLSTCTVNWVSQNPRPLALTGARADGRAVVLGYAIGEEAFVDSVNGNGVADPGEFTDTSEAFRDDNENGVRDANEPFIDFNGNRAFDGPDGKYNGVLQGAAFVGAPTSKNVFGNLVIVMSSSAANITSAPASIAAPGGFSVTVTDINGNTMPSGTTIAVTAPFGTLTGLISFTVPQNTGFGVTLPLFIAAGATPTVQTGVITVKVTSPGGLVTTRLIPISGLF